MLEEDSLYLESGVYLLDNQFSPVLTEDVGTGEPWWSLEVGIFVATGWKTSQVVRLECEGSCDLVATTMGEIFWAVNTWMHLQEA